MKLQLSTNLNCEEGSIPELLKQASNYLKAYHIKFDMQRIWRRIVIKNLSYNEAIKIIESYVDIKDENC